MGILGVIVLLGIAFAMSNNRSAISWKLVIWGLSLQFIFAIFAVFGPDKLEIRAHNKKLCQLYF